MRSFSRNIQWSQEIGWENGTNYEQEAILFDVHPNKFFRRTPNGMGEQTIKRRN